MNDTTYGEAVIAVVGEAAYSAHRDSLFELETDLRQRMISSLKLGLSIPDSLAEVHRSAILPDENYNRYIRYVAANSIF
jgi:hypothetical protein